jgi:hypothetical protein
MSITVNGELVGRSRVDHWTRKEEENNSENMASEFKEKKTVLTTIHPARLCDVDFPRAAQYMESMKNTVKRARTEPVRKVLR